MNKLQLVKRGLVTFLDFTKDDFYNPHITAITRSNISRPLKYLLKNELIESGNSVLDYGAGKLKDTTWLNENGYPCTPYDKYHPNEEISSLWCCFGTSYDVIICNYVFNVIEKLEDFESTLKIIKNIKAKRKFISVRNDVKSIKSNWIYDKKNDCYYTGRSYQRFINVKNLEKYFGKNKLIKKTSDFLLIELEV